MQIQNPVIIKIFPARKSVVSDIPDRDGKIANLFFYRAYTLPVEENRNAHQFAVMEEEGVEHIKEAVKEGPQLVRPRALQHSAQHAQRARLLLRFRRRAQILRDEGEDQRQDRLLAGPGQQPAASKSVCTGSKF
jgi:hypothetical protein